MSPGARRRWPEHLWIVRHGESAGNVARDAADAGGLELIDIAERDVDVPLSELGHTQAAALGRWFAALPPGARPNVVFASPYLRARETAEYIRRARRYRWRRRRRSSTNACARKSSAFSIG